MDAACEEEEDVFGQEQVHELVLLFGAGVRLCCSLAGAVPLCQGVVIP